MFRRYFERSSFLTFLPFGILYIVVACALGKETVLGDEQRYLHLARNLSNGFFSPPPPSINLWSGPGYPLLISPLMALGTSQLPMVLMNAILQYLSIVFLYKTIKKFCSPIVSALAGCTWGLFYTAWLWEMPLVLPESLTVLLCTLIAFFLVKNSEKEKALNKNILLAGIFLGYLTLTKIIFGYVILLLLIILLISFLLKRSRGALQLFFVVCTALILNLPYLFYTHSLTGKWFYWGNSGGLSLYWMSTPYEGEYGDWHGLELYESSQKNSQIAKNHEKDFEHLSSFQGVELDDELKRMAIENIKEHPGKFLRNGASNISRLLFDTPYYFASPTDLFLFRILPTVLVLPLFLTAFILLLFRFRKIPSSHQLIFLLVTFYFCLTVIVSAYHRQFYVMIPWMLILSTYILEQQVRSKLRIKENDQGL